ncbi:MAG: exo-alpha-sialidase [Cyanothece sp. SIO1E1]|nr:exo-alpha-sialidase [Cyanothece sp. SIO1E1]
MNTPTSKIILPASDTFTRHSEASMVELKDGTLLLAWSKFKGNHDNSKSHIACLLSKDGGHSWGEEKMLIENTAGLNVMSPAIRRLKDGSLGMVYNHRDSIRSARRVFCRSTDEGKSWSEPVIIADGSYITGGHDRLTVLSSGRIIAPLHATEDWDAHYLFVQVARSDDLGKTWELSEPVTVPKVDVAESGVNEPDVVERADGTLLIVMRSAMGTIFRTESFDQGVTWENLGSLEVTAPVAPCICRRIPESDDLLLVWNWKFDALDSMLGKRKRLSVAISSDGGDSWPLAQRKVIEPGEDGCFSYPSCTFYKDQVILTYYAMDEAIDFNFDGPRSLKLMHFPIEWLYT